MPAHVTTNVCDGVGSQENQDEIFDDIVANTNPVVISAFPESDHMIEARLCMHPSNAFFNAKQTLMMNNNLNSNMINNNPASECFSNFDDKDKIEYDLDLDKKSFASSIQEDRGMFDFMCLRNGGNYDPNYHRHQTCM